MMSSMRKLTKQIRDLDETIYELRTNGKENKEKREFILKCPLDNCNGYLNKNYICGLCDNEVCKDCMEKKVEDHICDKEKKETVTFLKRDTKSCPKCGEYIHKINGCDQMYCISCHTAFSWRTGKIERGNVHNPEYYRWMREHGRDIPRDPQDVVYDPCGLIDYMGLLRIVRSIYPSQLTTNRHIRDAPEVIKIVNMHRLIIHINNKNRVHEIDEDTNERKLLDLRANLLLDNISREELKVTLQKIDKKRNKEKKLLDIWNLLKFVLMEYIGEISEIRIDERRPLPGILIDKHQKRIAEIIEESKRIKNHCNNGFTKIGKTLNMTYPGINNEWIEIHNWETYIKEQKRRNPLFKED